MVETSSLPESRFPGAENAPRHPRSRGAFGILLVVALLAMLPAQRTSDTRPYWQRETGYVALQQAVLDAGSDTLVLLVASHPDDRYDQVGLAFELTRSVREGEAIL